MTADPTGARTAVLTIAAGRVRHLLAQQSGLAAGPRKPDVYVVVGMNDAESLSVTESGPLSGTGCLIRTESVPVGSGLPLAAARNAAAAAALAAGAQVLIFLDVDCVPSPSTVADYARAVSGAAGPALHCGTIRYLGPGESYQAAATGSPGTPHPARPNPPAGVVVVDHNWALFWSLSFAVAAADWVALGGFDEGFVGYGGEDTELAYRAFRAGWEFRWRGDPPVFHQFHTSEQPPVSHLREIVANATRFHDRWGFPIMQGWLQAFADRGLAHYDRSVGRWLVGPPVGDTGR